MFQKAYIGKFIQKNIWDDSLSNKAVKPRHLGLGYTFYSLICYNKHIVTLFRNTFPNMYQVLRLRIYHKHNTKLNKLASAGEELGLHSQTLQVIGETHAKARKQAKKNKLRWRTNRKDAKRKALG